MMPDGDARSRRASKATIERRVQKTIELILMGAPTPEIIQHITNSERVKKRQAFNYIKKATMVIKEEIAQDREYLKARGLMRIDRIYFRLMRSEKYNDAIRAEVEFQKLIGNYPSVKIEGTGDAGAIPLTIDIIGATNNVRKILGLDPVAVPEESNTGPEQDDDMA